MTTDNRIVSASLLVIEVNPLYRDALVRLLNTNLGYPEIAATGCIEEGMRLARTRPDLGVLLYDPGAAAPDGPETIAAFRRLCPRAGVIALVTSDHRSDASTLRDAGANAVVPKDAPIDTLIDVVRRVFNRVRDSSGNLPPCTATVVGPVSPLTPRQREVLALLAEGHPNKRIGLILGLAEITVKMHVSSIFRVLGVANRTQAVVAARRLGLNAMPDIEDPLPESRQA